MRTDTPMVMGRLPLCLLRAAPSLAMTQTLWTTRKTLML
ncbi:hypothetical protein E2C01_084518 [Portunus trituberculatus]|uniref:Uncharacterized protein n=1 Tax=Portunus trituberculatus TaxID=210409 RepID=A0A5B7JAZ1_PORTR|nr:hypothetical protein [Portunus trituberculatus]